MTKTYNELTLEERIITFNNWQAMAEKDDALKPFEYFEDYDDEQRILDMDFDAETLECLG